MRVFEASAATGLARNGAGVRVTTARGHVDARDVVIATAAYPAPLKRLGNYIMPLYDHVLMTEPLTEAQRASIGWGEGQGLTDAGNQFHYYRPTADGRILFGGWDAVYYFGGRVDASLEQRDSSHELLARHFLATFPQLAGLRFTHRWAGPIDSTTRFTAAYGTALGGRAAYAVGHTGLGVGASRFSADVALDLLVGRADVAAALRHRAAAAVPDPARAVPQPHRPVHPAIDPRRRCARGSAQPVAANPRPIRPRLQLMNPTLPLLPARLPARRSELSTAEPCSSVPPTRKPHSTGPRPEMRLP